MPGIGVETEADLTYFLPHVSEKVCMAINDILKIPNPDGKPPSYSVSASETDYAGSFATTSTVIDEDNVLTGQSAWCARQIEGHRYRQVLLAR